MPSVVPTNLYSLTSSSTTKSKVSVPGAPSNGLSIGHSAEPVLLELKTMSVQVKVCSNACPPTLMVRLASVIFHFPSIFSHPVAATGKGPKLEPSMVP
jgi:hypothetical protein